MEGVSRGAEKLKKMGQEERETREDRSGRQLAEGPKTAVTFVSPLKHWAHHWRSHTIMDQNGWFTGLNTESVMHMDSGRLTHDLKSQDRQVQNSKRTARCPGENGNDVIFQ